MKILQYTTNVWFLNYVTKNSNQENMLETEFTEFPLYHTFICTVVVIAALQRASSSCDLVFMFTSGFSSPFFPASLFSRSWVCRVLNGCMSCQVANFLPL